LRLSCGIAAQVNFKPALSLKIRGVMRGWTPAHVAADAVACADAAQLPRIDIQAEECEVPPQVSRAIAWPQMAERVGFEPLALPTTKSFVERL
jgi:hypothetical protein